MATKIERIDREITKTREKIAEYQEKLKTLEAQQHQTQVGIVLREAVQLRQVGEGADLRVGVGVLFAHEDQTFRHLVLQPLEQVTNVLVVDVERAAVDVRPLRQLPDGDGLGGLLGHEIHQSLP